MRVCNLSASQHKTKLHLYPLFLNNRPICISGKKGRYMILELSGKVRCAHNLLIIFSAGKPFKSIQLPVH